MPATFPSHQGAVLPLKVWRPRWFDGVALAVGAASPDVAYLLDGSGLPVWPFSHEWLGLVGWCLPVTVVISWLLRWAAPTVAAHFPNAGNLALRDYGALAPRPRRSGSGHCPVGTCTATGCDHLGRHRWWVTAVSAVIGGASHVLLDDVGDVTNAVESVFHVIGAAVTLAVLLEIGRHRLIRRWHGPAPRVARRPVLFWGTATAVFVTGSAVLPFLPAAFLMHTTGARLIAVITVAFLCGAAVASGRERIVAEAG